MTETQKPYVVNQAPAWTVAKTTDDWPPPVDRTLFVLPPDVTKWYVIDDDGKLHHNGENETAFRGLWDHLCRLEEVLPCAIGNVLNHAELAFQDPCPTCNGGDAVCYECNGFGYTQDGEYAPKEQCELCNGTGKCPDCLGYGTIEGTLYVEMMEKSGRKIGTLRQYKNVFNPNTGVAPERQRPGVKYSYVREIAPLPPAQQVAMLDRVEAGEFENSDQVHAERLRIQKEQPRETFAPPVPIACPICGDGIHGWDPERAQWNSCRNPTCGAHEDEILRHLAMLRNAVARFYQHGELDPLDAYVKEYHVCDLG